MAQRLAKFEELGWRSELGYTLNFTTVAHVTTPPSIEALGVGLDRLVVRHPNLSRGVDAPASRAPTVVEESAPADAWRQTITAELTHGSWRQGDAPVRVRLQHHPDGSASVLVTLYHPYSDGKSGMLAMRDLLAYTAEPEQHIEPLDASPLEDFLPKQAAARPVRRYFARMKRSAAVGQPASWRENPPGPPEQRVFRVAPVSCDREQTEALVARAKAEGVTLHAALSAALAYGWCAAAGFPGDLLVSFHPVDMRAYLVSWAEREGIAAPRIPETIGYYVSLIDVVLRLKRNDLWTDARALNAEIQAAKRDGVPLFTASAGATLIRIMQRLLGVRATRALLDGPLGNNAFALSNLGALERLGLQAGGAFGLKSVHFAGSPSTTSNVCASAVGFDGGIHMNVGSVSPSLPSDAAENVANATAQALQGALS